MPGENNMYVMTIKIDTESEKTVHRLRDVILRALHVMSDDEGERFEDLVPTFEIKKEVEDGQG
jgi:hypothetical protein